MGYDSSLRSKSYSESKKKWILLSASLLSFARFARMALTVSIVHKLPEGCYPIRKEINYNLYKFQNDYICSWIDQIFLTRTLFIKITATEADLKSRRHIPLAFEKSERNTFVNELCELCESVTREIFPSTGKFILKMSIEYTTMIFWANMAMIWVHQSRVDVHGWSDYAKLFYSLAQIIYVQFNEIQKGVARKILKKEKE